MSAPDLYVNIFDVFDVRTCRLCGCTDDHACPPMCSWVEEDLCSACATARCCDLHNRNCEPPSELCCAECTEAAHPHHRDGSSCIAPDLSANSPDAIAAKIERSSLGTPKAQALRDTVPDEHAARIVARARELEHEALRSIWREAAQKGIESGIDWPRIVLALFKDLDAAEQQIAIVLEISSWDRPYDTRIEAIRNELQGRR